jgi:RNA polymerase sigma factor (TIGR02999 family)
LVTVFKKNLATLTIESKIWLINGLAEMSRNAPEGAPREDITPLLVRLAKGDPTAMADLIPLVYAELHRLAVGQMRRERRPDHTLQPTALLHEAYLRLVKQPEIGWQNRSHFFGVAAKVMREIVIDHARARTRVKRDARRKISLDDVHVFAKEQPAELVALDDALQRLEKLDARQARVVEIHFFGGCTLQETAKALGISPKTVQRDWQFAKAWLKMQVEESYGSNAG